MSSRNNSITERTWTLKNLLLNYNHSLLFDGFYCLGFTGTNMFCSYPLFQEVSKHHWCNFPEERIEALCFQRVQNWLKQRQATLGAMLGGTLQQINNNGNSLGLEQNLRGTGTILWVCHFFILPYSMRTPPGTAFLLGGQNLSVSQKWHSKKTEQWENKQREMLSFSFEGRF